MQQLNPRAQSTSPAQSSNPVAQEFAQPLQDLQFGNISAAQQDYTRIKEDIQHQSTGTHPHHHHHGGGGGSSAISQLKDQLSQSLQSGNRSSAQQAYSALGGDFLRQVSTLRPVALNFNHQAMEVRLNPDLLAKLAELASQLIDLRYPS